MSIVHQLLYLESKGLERIGEVLRKSRFFTGRITKSLSWRLEVYLKYITGKLSGKTWQGMTLAGGDYEKLENDYETAKKTVMFQSYVKLPEGTKRDAVNWIDFACKKSKPNQGGDRRKNWERTAENVVFTWFISWRMERKL